MEWDNVVESVVMGSEGGNDVRIGECGGPEVGKGPM